MGEVLFFKRNTNKQFEGIMGNAQKLSEILKNKINNLKISDKINNKEIVSFNYKSII